MPNIGPMELIVVLAIALIFFGPKRLPEMGSSIGRGIREFKSSISGDNDSDDEEVALPQPTAVALEKDDRPAPLKVPVA